MKNWQKQLAAVIFLSCASLCAGEEAVWDSKNEFGKFRGAAELRSGVLFQKTDKANRSIYFFGKEFESARMNTVELIYRAENIPSNTIAHLFFIEKGQGIRGSDYWLLPGVIGDGEWHVLRVKLGPKVPDPKNFWYTPGKIVNVLRLDPVNKTAKDGWIEIKSLRIFDDAGE